MLVKWSNLKKPCWAKRCCLVNKEKTGEHISCADICLFCSLICLLDPAPYIKAVGMCILYVLCLDGGKLTSADAMDGLNDSEMIRG